MAGKGYTLTVRDGPKVRRERFSTLAGALEGLEQATSGRTGRQLRDTVDLRYREFAPMAQVAIRAELSGSRGLLSAVRGGIDVRGDGSTEAYTGRVRRRLVEPAAGETACDALRRVLAG